MESLDLEDIQAGMARWGLKERKVTWENRDLLDPGLEESLISGGVGTTCPSTTGTELVYAGRAAGSHYNQKGGTSDYLCLPEEPEYLAYKPGVQGDSPIHGAEYETWDNRPLSHVDDHNAPCVICHSTVRESVLMIPARRPGHWSTVGI